MHLVVLGAFWHMNGGIDRVGHCLNALVVLGAFWQENIYMPASSLQRLNAPSGAGCFLTLPLGMASLRHFRRLGRRRLCKHPAGPDGSAPI